jgi:hypothetical protein
LAQCLKGLIKDIEGLNYTVKIVILDNHSDDDLSDLEIQYKDKGVQFFYSEKNLGFGAAHNLLAQKFDSKYILLLNPDIRFIQKDTILNSLKYMNDNQKIKVLGIKLINDLDKDGFYDHGELLALRARLRRKIGRSYWVKRDKPIEAAWVSGAFFLIERDIFEKVNGFDEHFFLYKEEEDLCLRVCKLGHKILYYPYIVAFHNSSVLTRTSKHFDESEKYFIEKNLNKLSYSFFMFLRKMYLIAKKLFTLNDG